MRTRFLLECALARLRRGWCQNADALDSEGHRTDPCSPTAVSWSAAGAVEAEIRSASDGDSEEGPIFAALGTDDYGYIALQFWNDMEERTQQQVIALFERAIAKCSESTESA
jgi:hypothetical protein